MTKLFYAQAGEYKVGRLDRGPGFWFRLNAGNWSWWDLGLGLGHGGCFCLAFGL